MYLFGISMIQLILLIVSVQSLNNLYYNGQRYSSNDGLNLAQMDWNGFADGFGHGFDNGFGNQFGNGFTGNINGYTINNGNVQKCEIKTRDGIKTMEELQEVVNSANDGDVIRLDPITYFGDLEIKRKNNVFITIDGDNQCNNSTKIIGQITVTDSTNWIIKDLVFENNDIAVKMERSDSIKCINLVINTIDGNGIQADHSNDLVVDNIVMNYITANALEFTNGNKILVSNIVVSKVKGIALLCESCKDISVKNTVANGVEQEVIKISGSNGRISGTVINGNSFRGEGWMNINGDFFLIENTVATGAPKQGILINGCNYKFTSNMFTNMGNGFTIFAKNAKTKPKNCRIDIGRTNMNIGGMALKNWK